VAGGAGADTTLSIFNPLDLDLSSIYNGVDQRLRFGSGWKPEIKAEAMRAILTENSISREPACFFNLYKVELEAAAPVFNSFPIGRHSLYDQCWCVVMCKVWNCRGCCVLE